MSDITVVCCWNNEKVYSDFVGTLKAQTCQCEIIGIDNRGNQGFTSCAAAYNSVIDRIKTKYVIYSHQDILLNDQEALEKFVSYLERTGQDDILGVAGTKFDIYDGGFSNIFYRNNATGELVHSTTYFPEGGMMECDTLDECFFGGHTEHFREYPFDERVCDNWHLYAVESSLRTKALLGGKVWCCDVSLLHLSSGTISPTFQYGFYKVCRKYADYFPFIRTTCGTARTDFIHLFPRFIYLWSHSMAGVILRKIGLYEAVKKITH